MATIRVKTFEKEKKNRSNLKLVMPTNTGNGLSYVGQRLGIGALSVFEGAGKLFEGTAALLSGDENYAKYVFTKSEVGEWREDLEDDYNPGGFMSFLGDVGEGVGQSSVMLANAAVPFLGTGMFFTGIAGNSIGNAVAQTGDIGWKEYGYGLTVAGAEAMMETIIGAGGQAAKSLATAGAKTAAKSVGKATVKRAVRNGVLKNILLEGSGEFVEEFLGDYVDVTAQKMFGINENAEYSLTNALYSGLVGFVSGSAMGGGTQAIQASTYISSGSRVQKNGNVQTLLKQAELVSANYATMGGGMTKRTRMSQYISFIQASYDAYNALSEEAKAGTRGALYLGELQSAMAAFQSTQGVEKSAAYIRTKPEKFAVYASQRSGKTYTVEDLLSNKDGILDRLAVEHFVGQFMTASEAEQFENGIREMIRRESAGEAADRVAFEEMGFSPEDAADAASRVTHEDGVTMISDSGAWDGESAAYKIPGGEYVFVFENGDGTYNVGVGAEADFAGGKIRIANLTREEVKEYLARVEENRILAERSAREAAATAEIREESANKEEQSADSEEVSEESQTSEKKYSLAKENSDLNNLIRKVKNGEFKANEKVVFGEVSTEVAKRIKEITGIDVTGYSIAIEARQIEHILKRHGENGTADHSLANDTDLAKMEYVLENPDSIEEAGRTQAYTYSKEGKNRTAPTVKLEKVIGDKSYYVVEAVPEAKAKTLYVVTAFVGKSTKKEASQLIDANAPMQTSENGSVVTSKNSIPQTESSVKSEEEKNFEDNAETSEKSKEEQEAEEREAIEKYTELASIQDRARRVVEDYDLWSGNVRYAIEQMYRSADEAGADASAADAAAHLLAVFNGDVQIRFAKGISKNGLIDTITDEDGTRHTVILINPQTDAEGGATATLLHEVTHYLEGREGYDKLSKLAMEQLPAEKAEEIRKRYRDYAEKNGKNFSDEYIEQEVVAEAVGELLAEGKYIARMRNRSVIVNAASWMARHVKALVGKNREVHRAALKLQNAFTRCLARTKAEAAEVIGKYSFAGNDSLGDEIPADEIQGFIQSVLSMKDRTKISKRRKRLGTVSASHAEIIERETGLDATGYEIWIDGSSVKHIDERHGANGKADQSLRDIKEFARMAYVVNHADEGEVLYNSDGTPDADTTYQNKDQSPAVKLKLSMRDANGIYYVVECVPDNTDKRLYIKSAYRQKNSDNGQQLNMVDSTLQQTPEAFVDGIATTNSIPHPSDSVKGETKKFSLSKSETAEERAERLERETKREKARADRLAAELHTYQEYGINSGDVYALANTRMKDYNGDLDKNLLRRMLVEAVDRIAYLRKNKNSLNAATIGRNIDKYISDFAEEVIYHQKEEVDPRLKEMRSYMKEMRVSISEDLKGDLDRFGGYEAFRRQNMGRGLILSKEGTPVESIYPELTAQFGEDAFPSKIKNPVDQLIQIADTLREGTKSDGQFVDFTDLVRAEEQLIRAELTTIVRNAEQAKRAYNPVWNASTFDGSNAAVVTYYTPDAAKRIMNAADELVKEWAEKNGATKQFRSGMRERMESEFQYLLNTAQKSDRADAAERLAAELMKAQVYLVGAEKVQKTNKNGKPYTVWEGGKKYTAKTLPDADARGFFEELANAIRIKANAEENLSEGIYYALTETAENAALREEVASLKSQAALAARIKSLSDLAKGKTKPSERVSLDEMNAVIDEFSKTVVKGRISPERTQKFVLWLNTYLSSKEPTGVISYLKGAITDGTLEILNEFATVDVSEPGALGMLQLKALNDLFFELRHAYDTYGMVKLDGEWKDSVEVAKKGVKDANGSLLHLNRRKTLRQKLSRGVLEFLLQSQDPLRAVAMLEGYAENGVLSKLIYDVVMGEAYRVSMQMDFLKPFEDFFKAHKGYQQKLATKEIELDMFSDGKNKFKITLGEAMSMLGLSKREQAKAGLANSDIYFASDEEGTRMVQGGWARWADMDADQRISMLTGGISELVKKLEKEDLEFFKMVENFFNVVSTDVKKRSDVDYFGHEMTMESYYFPIYRDRSTIAEEVADAAKRMQSFITVSNQSFNKQTMKNASKSLYIANVYDVVTQHATGLATYATLYRPVLNFNTIWNQQTSGNKNSPESMRSVYERNVWDGVNGYMKSLFDAVQGIRDRKTPFSGIISKIRGNAVFFQLGLNPKTWLTQWTSLIASLDVLSASSLQKGIAAGKKANDADMDKYSVFARTRDYNMEVVKAEGAGDQIHKVGELTMKPISLMDRMVIRKLWAACQYEVESKQGLAIGSEENNVAAGKLLDTVILRTQQTAGMATKSGLMRGGELAKSLTMFSSDAMKQLSSIAERIGRYQRARVDVKNGVAGAEERLAQSKKALAKTGASLIGVAVAGAIIAQVFKALYDRDRRKKKDGTEISMPADVALDSLGNFVGVIPVVRDVYDMIDSGYEVSDFTLDAFNNIISGYLQVGEDVIRAIGGEYVSNEEIAADVRQFIYSTGMVLGIPTRNFNNILEGGLNVTTDQGHWWYTSLFQKPSYEKDLQEAVNSGDTALAELILETWLEREKVGSVGDETDVLMELYAKGYDFLPASAPSKLSAKQRKEWMESMEEVQSEAAQMVTSSTWQSFTDEAKAEALKKLYQNRQNALKAKLQGKKTSRGAVLAEWYGDIPVAEISGMAAATEAYEDESGREVTRREQVEELLAQYEGDEAILLYIAGFTSKEAKRLLAERVMEIAATEDERNALYKTLGIDPEDL